MSFIERAIFADFCPQEPYFVYCKKDDIRLFIKTSGGTVNFSRIKCSALQQTFKQELLRIFPKIPGFIVVCWVTEVGNNHWNVYCGYTFASVELGKIL